MARAPALLDLICRKSGTLSLGSILAKGRFIPNKTATVSLLGERGLDALLISLLQYVPGLSRVCDCAGAPGVPELRSPRWRLLS